MYDMEDKVTVGKIEYSVTYKVKGEELEDLIDLTITDVFHHGESVYANIKKEGLLDTLYNRILDSKISSW